jgi:amidase
MIFLLPYSPFVGNRPATVAECAMTDQRQIITSEHVIYHFHPAMQPQWRVQPGQALEIRCPDGVNGRIRSEQDRLVVVDPDRINDAVGPIFVEGAEPGDRLVFDIQDIRVPQDWGYILILPSCGLQQSKVGAARTTIVPIADGKVQFAGTAIPLDPCIGTIGVAPAEGRYSTLIPFDHGGNLDTTAIRAGARVHFPVNQPGALLALGDPKAVMGDGEVCGTGVGVPINVFAHIEVIKGGRRPRPIIETATEWQFVASAETLEGACRLANGDLIDTVRDVRGVSWEQAYMLSSLVAHLRISQVVDPLMTVRMAISKDYLPTLDPPAS